jgi:hypothetical protein|nr:MAG TPA: hypothetical protein [Bacteriophage sp.]
MPELDLGNVKGPQGKSAYQSALDAGYSGSEEAFNTAMAKAPDAVLYTVQSLTDEQKAQARGNINAAPGGFGWGEAMKDVLASETEDTYETYCGKLDVLLADMPDKTSQLIYTRGPVSTGQYSGAGNIVAVLSKILGTSASLIGLSPDPRGTTNGLWRMLKDNGNWQPVEWINPPMTLGTEYRTTERYLGKPVYTKVVNCGNLPDGTTAEVAHGIANVGIVVGAQAIASNSDTGFNGLVYLPSIYNGSLTDQWTVYLAGVDYQKIRIFCGGGLAGRPVYVTLKYTKTTD